MDRFRSLAALACTGWLAGCAVPDSLPHPRAWAAASQAALPNGCPDLSGTFAVEASEAYPADAGPPPRLDALLGPGGVHEPQHGAPRWPAFPATATATLASHGDWLDVSFRGAGGQEAVVRFKRKDWWGGTVEGSDAMYQCRELELGPAAGFDGARRRISAVPYVFAKGDADFLFLSRAKDGSLVVNHRTVQVVGTGVLVGSSARWVASTWWRYAPSVQKP